MTRALIAAALLLAACGDGGSREPGTTPPDRTGNPPFSMETLPPDTPPPVPEARPLPARPELLLDSVRIEGDWQRAELRLVRSPAGFEPPFTTYLPSGLEVHFEVPDSAPSVRFIAAFGGRVNPEAFLQVRVYPEGTTRAAAEREVTAYLAGRGPRQDQVTRSEGWPWTEAAWDFHYGAGPDTGGYLGTMGLGRYGNRFFHVLAHYPAEYGDGVGPRFHRILQEWRWEIDGARLIGE
jgi:hypothetical protein